MDAKTIVNQFRLLSVDVDNQPYIAREPGCLAGLTTFLSQTDADVVTGSLETLQNLSSHPDNVQIMADEFELVSKLRAVLLKPLGKEQKELAEMCLQNLGVSIEEKVAPAEYPEPATSNQTDSQETHSHPDENQTPQAKLRTVHFHIESMAYPEDRDKIEAALLALPGVISVTSELSKEITSVRTRASIEDILATLEVAGHPGKIATEEQEASLLGTTPEAGPTSAAEKGGESGKENHADSPKDSPQYLPPPKFTDHTKRALTTRRDNSLEARLEEQRRLEIKKRHKQEASRRGLLGRVSQAFKLW